MNIIVVAKPKTVPLNVCVQKVGVNANSCSFSEKALNQITKPSYNPVPSDAIMVRAEDNAILINGVLANVQYYEIIVPKKVMKITFVDGTSEKVVCKKGDPFSVEDGIRIAIAKHVGRPYYNLKGIENLATRLSYLKCIDKMISKVIRQYEQEQKQIKKLEENQRAIEEAKVRKAEKAARKREARRKSKECEKKTCDAASCKCDQYEGPNKDDEATPRDNRSHVTIRTRRHSTKRDDKNQK